MAEPGKPALADLVKQGDQQESAQEIAPGIFAIRDISNAYLLNCDGSDVMVNTGFMDNAQRNLALFAPHRSGPLATIVITQSHPDHFGGLGVFPEADTQVLAGPGYWQNWLDMKRLQPFFGPRTRKLWGSTLKRGTAPTPPPEVQPDIEVTDGFCFGLGERRFELLHTPEGETTDGLTVWLPNERIAFTGNLFGPVWLSMPFLNTLRGDKPRSVRTYLRSLERVRDLDAEMIVTGHGDPIIGRARIRADLDRMHGAVSFVRDATLDGMNAGKSLHQLMAEITLPDDLAIGQFHGKVSWAVKAVWHEYSGWFFYESTTELYGVPRSAINADLLELCGGAGALAARAAAHVAAGRPLEALHLTDIALGAEPGSKPALEQKRAALEMLLAASGGSNLSETMWLRSEIAEVDALLTTAEQP